MKKILFMTKDKSKNGEITFRWDTEEERLLRFMKISPKKKLEWLRDMNDFLAKTSSKRQRLIRQQLRDSR